MNPRWLAAPAACALLLGSSVAAGASGTGALPVKVHVALARHRVVAGQPIKGTVVLTNTTTKVILVNSCAANGWLQVGLKGHGYSYEARSLLIKCAPSIHLRPGKNRFPVTVLTTYQGCQQPPGQPAGPTPACTPSGPPALPAGMYSTTVSIVGLEHLTEAPNRVTVSLQRSIGKG